MLYVHVCVCANVKCTRTHQRQVKNLRHALTSSHNENQFLRTRLAKMQMASLPPLHLVPLSEEKKEKDGASVEDSNQTDQEKAVARQVSNLRKVSLHLRRALRACVVMEQSKRTMYEWWSSMCRDGVE